MSSTYEQGMDALSRELSGVGVPKEYAALVACGLMDKLKHWCWSSMTDILGEGDNVDRIVGWSGRQSGVAAPLLFRCALAGCEKGVYYLPSAIRECPEYFRQKWRRTNKVSYELAVERAAAPLVRTTAVARDKATPRPEPVETAPSPGEEKVSIPTGLFETEAPEEKKREQERKGHPGHKELVTYFCDAWAGRHGGTRYPFTAADGAHIKRILTAAGDLATARRVVDAFLSSTDRWHRQRGFRLGLLVADLPAFLAKANGHDASVPGGLAYAGAGEALPGVGDGKN